MKYQDFVMRRAEFLLSEAKNGFTKRDIAITFVLRALSNYLTVGVSGNSNDVKRLNVWISKAALERRSQVPYAQWHKETVNEHQQPLKEIWKEICANCDSMTVQDVCDLIARHPFVTVLRDEDARLRSSSVRSATSPEERYQLAGIEVVRWK